MLADHEWMLKHRKELKKFTLEPLPFDSIETVGEVEDTSFEDDANLRDAACAIRKAMRCLSHRERHTLICRFWLELTLKETGNRWPVPRSIDRVSQIEKIALRKLKHPRIRKLFDGFVNPDKLRSYRYTKPSEQTGKALFVEFVGFKGLRDRTVPELVELCRNELSAGITDAYARLSVRLKALSDKQGRSLLDLVDECHTYMSEGPNLYRVD